ncbi:hypothetical protein PybrP1_005635 [[Pythium] brassicae (nom. inval.)]|nr:hypothetical protein PybrP1_005635 [[Pythium] brassicae (nom. inval.)]
MAHGYFRTQLDSSTTLPAATAMIAGFETLELLGSGQFGDVHLVRRLRDGQLFAAKVAHRHRLASGGGGGDGAPHPLLLQEKQEADLLRRLNHPNITQCVDIVGYDGELDSDHQPAIVMEYASGGDLDAFLRLYQYRGEPISEQEIMRIFVQIALALEYLHTNRILHRDFGISRTMQHTLDVAQTVAGTPYYMSPELMDDQPYGAKSDVWSLGCILHELATFSPPFSGKALGAVVFQIMNAEPPALPPLYSRELQDLVKTLLTKDPRVRTQCLRECVLAQIRDVLRSEFVLRHVFQAASAAPFQLVQRLKQIPCSSGMSRQQLSSVLPQQASIPCQAAQPRPLNPLERLRPPADNKIYSQYQPEQLQQQKPPPAQQNHQRLPQSDDLARQIFFENQAAARRNRERVDRERLAPAVFLAECAPELRHPLRDGVCPHPSQKPHCSSASALEGAKHCFLENARIARLNKQRALDAMQAPTLPAPAPVPLGKRTESAGSEMSAPPLAPTISRKERNSA